MAEYVCNYALIRFLPYRDAGEFVNIGVALACAELGFLDFRVEAHRYARVTHFFPELEAHVYREGVKALRAECDRWRESAKHFAERHRRDGEAAMRHIFGELTRAQESVFHFGAPRTLLTTDPTAALDELFTRYVRRQFIVESVHGEEAMRRRIAQSLRSFGVERLYKTARIGTSDYNVPFPFVSAPEATEGQLDLGLVHTARKAIKPLNLNRDEPSEITQHGDDWYMKVMRLGENGHLPPHVLFSVQSPKEGQRLITAASRVRRDLESLNIITIDFEDTESLKAFSDTGSLN